MARRSSQRPRVLDVVLTALLSLYLLGVCIVTSGWVESTVTGPVGDWLGNLVRALVGPVLCWGLPLAPWIWIPLRRTKGRWPRVRQVAVGSLAYAAAAAFLAHDQLSRIGVAEDAGGKVGDLLEGSVAALVGSLGSFLVLASLCSWLLLRRLPPLHVDLPALDGLTEVVGRAFQAIGGGLASLRELVAQAMGALRDRLLDARDAWVEARRRDVVESADDAEDHLGDEEDEDEYEYEEDDADEDEDEDEEEWEEEYEEEDVAAAPQAFAPRVIEADAPRDPQWAGHGEGDDFRISRDPSELTAADKSPSGRPRRRRGDYPLPGLDLLDEFEKEQRGFTTEVLKMNAHLLLDTLNNFGIQGQINEIRPGPVVTTFEFEPAPGVKVSQIVSRSDDLALAMRATRIRIEAPIPGKAAVGIEIPNPYPQIVGLRQVIGAIEEDGAEAPLSMAFGKDTEGEPFIADLADMPHLLVAGATGSGKSVCVNAIICNLLLRNGPDRVRLLMIDPKMLELSVYNGIPHLMHPVITEAREALKAVKYMVAEMETRYAMLARHGVRNIKDFNEKIRAGKAVDEKTGEKIRDPLAYCVFIIDELADLMMQLGNDLETPVARLAQMARAVGIHLVLATQRPSVNVITGVIKANFPSRIGFRVISKIDSRTILDGSGAEQLLGKGDMLFLLAGKAQPVRVHGAFLSMEECERIVAHWKQHAEDEPAQLDLDGGTGGMAAVDLGEDVLLDQARDLVVSTQMGSTTMLQRRLRVGYTRAARLMDMLEAEGVVGPFEGSKARKVLVQGDGMEADA